MGLNYSFHFFAARSGADALLESLAARVGRGYARNLRAALPWKPERGGVVEAGVRGLAPMLAIPNYYDLVVLLPVDREVERYFTLREARLADHMEGGKAGVGLMYMSLFAGEQSVVLTLTAATSTMSTMLASSGSARGVMIALATQAHAHAVFLDWERDDSWDLLYPLSSTHSYVKTVPRELWRPQGTLEDVDSHCRRTLELAGVSIDGRTVPQAGRRGRRGAS